MVLSTTWSGYLHISRISCPNFVFLVSRGCSSGVPVLYCRVHVSNFCHCLVILFTFACWFREIRTISSTAALLYCAEVLDITIHLLMAFKTCVNLLRFNSFVSVFGGIFRSN